MAWTFTRTERLVRANSAREPLRQARERPAQAVRCGAGMQDGVVPFGFDPVHHLDRHEDQPSALVYREAVQRLLVQSHELLDAGDIAVFGGDASRRALVRLPEAIRVDGLQQVIHRLGLKRPHRVLVVRGHEDHGRHRVRADALEHLEAVEAGHLHVEDQEIGYVARDGLDGRFAVGTLGHDLGVLECGEVLAQCQPPRRLVVHDHDPHLSPRFAKEGRL